PYNKLMVANPSVNMGGALLLTSLARARAAGIAEDKLVYPLGGASAEEPRDYLLRDQFYESHPQNAVLKAAMDLAGGDGKKFDAIELYSCFPCVPKMARRLRDGARLGLLYGQGGFVTKHHALVVSKAPPREALAQETSVQGEADRSKRAVPEFATEATGKGKVESFTVLYGRSGDVDHGVVMLRTQDDRRTLARIPAS